jgi:antitoxin HicB
MKIEYPYTVEQQEDGGSLVQFVDFEEAFTEGYTPEEVVFNAAEVLTGIIAHRLDKGQEIPAPSLVEKAAYIAPGAAVQSALLLHLARQEQNKTVADMARALGTSWPAAARLEDPKHWPTLRQLDRAAAVLGKRLVISFA